LSIGKNKKKQNVEFIWDLVIGIYLEIRNLDLEIPPERSEVWLRGREAFLVHWSRRVTKGGALRRENVGLSNRNADESSAHRKFKVSLAMVINQGLGGPKGKPRGVLDG